MLGFKMFKGLSRLVRLALFGGVCFTPAIAFAGTPVLIEFYGNSYKCAANKTVEREVEELLAKYPDAILLHCRVNNPPELPVQEAFGRDFCNEERIGYFQEMRLYGMVTPMIIINGRYDANNEKIESALKVAQSVDQVAKISISSSENGLDISVPADVHKGGVLYLYTYASFEKSEESYSAGNQSNRPQAPLLFGDEAIDTEKSFRPIVKREKIADRSVGAMQLTVPLPYEPFPDYAGASLGYVVVVHERGLSSPVVAVGELPAQPVMYTSIGEKPPLPLTEPVLPFKVVPEISPAPPPS